MRNRWMSLLLVAATSFTACDDAGEKPKNPLLTVASPRPTETHFRGTVKELADAGSYTYLRVARDDASERWVVTLGDGAEIGERVAVHNFGTKTNFRSKRLGRTFDELAFGIVRHTDE